MISSKIKGYIKVKIIVTKSDGTFLAECPELDVFTQGKKLGDAIEKIHEAICLYLDTLEEEGLIEEVFKNKKIKYHKHQTKQMADKSPIVVEQTYSFAC
jgi:predicted RNase H-like HicB family nuclease